MCKFGQVRVVFMMWFTCMCSLWWYYQYFDTYFLSNFIQLPTAATLHCSLWSAGLKISLSGRRHCLFIRLVSKLWCRFFYLVYSIDIVYFDWLQWWIWRKSVAASQCSQMMIVYKIYYSYLPMKSGAVCPHELFIINYHD